MCVSVSECVCVQVLFSRLKKTRPFHGVKMRWKNLVTRDLRALNLQKIRVDGTRQLKIGISGIPCVVRD